METVALRSTSCVRICSLTQEAGAFAQGAQNLAGVGPWWCCNQAGEGPSGKSSEYSVISNNIYDVVLALSSKDSKRSGTEASPY